MSAALNIIDTGIAAIEQLVSVRSKIQQLLLALGRQADAQSITFRIRNYNKWLDTLATNKKNGIILNTVETIKKQKYTTKLEANLLNILESGIMTELTDANTELAALEIACAGVGLSADDVFKGNFKHAPAVTTSAPTIDTGNFNVSDMKSLPKQLDKPRPADPHEAAIYDLRLVHDIGEEGAQKLYKAGITLELLLNDWKQYAAKDVGNSVLMYSEMEKPGKYNATEWKLFSQTKRNDIQAQILQTRLELESKYLFKLHYAQLVGIKHFYNIRAERIPRSEVEKNEQVLHTFAKHFNSDAIVTICGSYRRGLPSSGDIDCLITHPELKTKEDLDDNSEFLKMFVNKLSNSHYLVDHLTSEGKKKYMGMAEIAGVSVCPRRIDIRLIPYNSYGAALLYFTGSKNFNTNMRAHAQSMHYMLNEYGLYKFVGGVKGEQVECPTEEDIFKVLKMDFKTPQERDI